MFQLMEEEGEFGNMKNEGGPVYPCFLKVAGVSQKGV